MRPPILFGLVLLGACAPQSAPPPPAAALPGATRAAPPASGAPDAPTVIGVVPRERPVEPGYNPLDRGAMEQYPVMPQQVPPAFRGP